MAVPDFQTIMRPLLALHADGLEHAVASVRAQVADHFELAEAEREERLPSGRQRRFDNRVGWATTYLAQTGLLTRPGRGVTRITARGHEMLEREPTRIDLGVLSQFPELEAFRARHSPDRGSRPQDARVSVTAPPEPARLLKKRSRARTGSCARPSPRISALASVGRDRRSSSSLSSNVIYVQAKRWQGSVGRPVIQAFVGALQGARASKGVMITTSTFTAEAQRYAEGVSPRVILVDGRELAELMLDHDVGVSTSTRYEIKNVDEDYFGDPDLDDEEPSGTS